MDWITGYSDTGSSVPIYLESPAEYAIDYTLNLTLDPETMQIAGSAGKTYHEQAGEQGVWVDVLEREVAVTWSSNAATEIITEIYAGYDEWSEANEFCGVGYSGGVHGEYSPSELKNNYTDAVVNVESFGVVREENERMGNYCRHLEMDIRYELDNEYTTAMLEQYTSEDVEKLSVSYEWPGIEWGSTLSQVVPSALSCPPTFPVTTQTESSSVSSRSLSGDEITLLLNETAFRFSVDTEADQVYELTWIEHFVPDPITNPNGQPEILNAKTIKFKGTGGVVYLGDLENENEPVSSQYTVLEGPDKGDDFTLDPPTSQQGNGHIELDVLSVEFVDASLQATDDLKIAKWENGFNSGPPVTLKNDFIDLDPDRFFIRVKDPSKAGQGPISVNLSSDNPNISYNDDPTVVELEETSSGVFVSESLLIVADEVDDDYAVDSIADDQINDRTHLAYLGGKMVVEYDLSSGPITREANVPQPNFLKEVSIHFVILEDTPGHPVVPVSKVINDIKVLREIFGQIGVTVNVADNNIPIAPTPGNVDIADADGLLVQPLGQTGIVADESKNLIDALGTSTSVIDIHVFYVTKITRGLNSTAEVVPQTEPVESTFKQALRFSHCDCDLLYLLSGKLSIG